MNGTKLTTIEDVKAQRVENLYFDKDKADALVERLESIELEEEGIIEITSYEKSVLFTLMQCQTMISAPGLLIISDEFERNFTMGNIRWGNSVFKLAEKK